MSNSHLSNKYYRQPSSSMSLKAPSQGYGDQIQLSKDIHGHYYQLFG